MCDYCTLYGCLTLRQLQWSWQESCRYELAFLLNVVAYLYVVWLLDVMPTLVELAGIFLADQNNHDLVGVIGRGCLLCILWWS